MSGGEHRRREEPAIPDVEGLLSNMRGGRAPRRMAMFETGLRMLIHDRLKLAGTVFGVVIAVVLAVQQFGVLLGLLQKNTMFVESSGADVFVAPPGTEQMQPGSLLPEVALSEARTVEGVAIAEPLIFAAASVLLPEGGTESVTLVGTTIPHLLGGPWNVVAGDPKRLADPDAMFFEDSRREELGGLNLGSRREVNGRAVTAVGFTWGLLPFGPPFAFAEIDLAREIAGVPKDRMHFVLIEVSPGVDPAVVARRLGRALPQSKVMTTNEFHDEIVRALLEEQLGVSFGTSTFFGLTVGFVIVALTMFSSVLDRLREFGTLKAIGARNTDLARLLFAQSFTYAMVGSLVGLAIAVQLSAMIRSPELVVITPGWAYVVVPASMLILCVLAATLALTRIRRLDPGEAFR